MTINLMPWREVHHFNHGLLFLVRIFTISVILILILSAYFFDLKQKALYQKGKNDYLETKIRQLQLTDFSTVRKKFSHTLEDIKMTRDLRNQQIIFF